MSPDKIFGIAASIVFLIFALIVFGIAIFQIKEERRGTSWFFCTLGSLFLIFVAMICAIKTDFWIDVLFLWGVIEFVAAIMLRIFMPRIIKRRQEKRQKIERAKAREAYERRQRAERQRLDSARSNPDFVAAANRIALIYRSLKSVEWIHSVEIRATPICYEGADACTEKGFHFYTHDFVIMHTIYIQCWFSGDDVEWGAAWPEFKKTFDEWGHKESYSELFAMWEKRWLKLFQSADAADFRSSTGMDMNVLGECILKLDYDTYELIYPLDVKGLPKDLLMNEAQSLANARPNG